MGIGNVNLSGGLFAGPSICELVFNDNGNKFMPMWIVPAALDQVCFTIAFF